MLDAYTNIDGEILKNLRAQNLEYQKKLIEQQEQIAAEQKRYIEELKQKDTQIEFLNIQLIILKKFKYGRSSEKFSGQLGFFNEAESILEAAAADSMGSFAPAKNAKRRGVPKRRPIPENLPRREVIIELKPGQMQCPHDGAELKEIGRETSEKLNIIPATIEVVRTIRIKYGCGSCKSFVATAPVPEHILPKSLADVGLLALIVVSKYVDAMPLYRIESILKRIGANIPRCTMASWVVELGAKFIILTNLLRDKLLDHDYIRADETRVLVLDNKAKTTKKIQSTEPKNGYMWVYTTAGPDPIVIFDYQPGRGKEAAKEMLEGFCGYLQVDGYGSYDGLCGEDKATRVGCWAHVRRKFYEAWVTLKKPTSGLALEALELIKRLYVIEEVVRKQTTSERHSYRKLHSAPLIDEMRAWLNEALKKCLPKSATGLAVKYMHNEWPNLSVFLEDGRLETDNNFTENKIRPFAVGRKNWLFSATTKGAESSSVLYSLFETAKANGLDPYSYLYWLLVNFPKAKMPEDFENLLPHRAKTLMKTSPDLQHVLP